MQLRRKKVGFVACSNALQADKRDEIKRLDDVLMQMEITPVHSPWLYGKENEAAAPARDRADVLMSFYEDPDIAAIFDLSGGDLGNECLQYMNMEKIARTNKTFWGYSDLSTILNGVYSQTGKEGVLYQMRNLVRAQGTLQTDRFRRCLDGRDEELFSPNWEFVRGEHMEGILVGGNLRCFLKLAGTPYFPEPDGKLLFIEAWGGSPAFIRTALTQLKQMGVFEKACGLLFGTFTAAEQQYGRKKVIETIVSCMEENDLPIACTSEIGHGADSKALILGKYSRMSKQ